MISGGTGPVQFLGTQDDGIRSSRGARFTMVIRRAVERYLAKGTEDLSAADATFLRRLSSWVLLVSVLIPVIVLQQILGPQHTTALVNTCYGLVTVACRTWALRGERRVRVARALRAHDVILVASVLDVIVTALLNGGIQAAGLWYLSLIPFRAPRAAAAGAHEPGWQRPQVH